MKLLKSVGFVALGGLFLSGCSLLSGGELSNTEDTRPISEKIEDASSYKKTKTASLVNSENDLCNKFNDFQNQVKAGDIFEQKLFSGEETNLAIFRTDNYQGFTNSNISDYNAKCSGGADAKRIMKVLPEYIVWGTSSCAVEIVPNDGDPLRQEFLDCLEVAEDLQEYLSN